MRTPPAGCPGIPTEVALLAVLGAIAALFIATILYQLAVEWWERRHGPPPPPSLDQIAQWRSLE